MAVYTVSQVSQHVKEVLESDPLLADVLVEGEVSNLRVSSAGHSYFSLKDDQALLNCVMFRGQPGAELLAGGTAVLVHGRLQFYEPRGTTDFMVDLAMAAGVALLTKLQVPGFHDALSQRVQTLCNGLQERANAARVPMMTQSAGGMFGLFFTSQSRVDNFAQATACNPDAFRRFFGAMLDHGVYLAPSAYEAGFMSSAHTPEDIQLTLDAAEKAFAVM